MVLLSISWRRWIDLNIGKYLFVDLRCKIWFFIDLAADDDLTLTLLQTIRRRRHLHGRYRGAKSPTSGRRRRPSRPGLPDAFPRYRIELSKFGIRFFNFQPSICAEMGFWIACGVTRRVDAIENQRCQFYVLDVTPNLSQLNLQRWFLNS